MIPSLQGLGVRTGGEQSESRNARSNSNEVDSHGPSIGRIGVVH